MTDLSETFVVQRCEEIDTDYFVLARLGDKRDDHVLMRAIMASGLFIPLHRHDDIECLHVMSGSLDVYRGNYGRWFRVGAGASIVVPPDVAHAIRNITDAPASTPRWRRVSWKVTSTLQRRTNHDPIWAG